MIIICFHGTPSVLATQGLCPAPSPDVLHLTSGHDGGTYGLLLWSAAEELLSVDGEQNQSGSGATVSRGAGGGQEG